MACGCRPMWIQTALEQLLWELRQWRAPASIASEQAINRLSGYPTLGPEFPQNRELTGNYDR